MTIHPLPLTESPCRPSEPKKQKKSNPPSPSPSPSPPPPSSSPPSTPAQSREEVPDEESRQQLAEGNLSAERVVEEAQQQRHQLLLRDADVLRHRHKFADAIVAYDRVLALVPNCVDALNGKGVSLRDLSRPAEAMVCHERALRIAPSDWRAHNNKGMILKHFSLFDDALKSYSRALVLCDKFDDAVIRANMAIVLNDIGTRLKLAGSVDAAIARYKEAIVLKPEYALSYFNVGVLFSAMGRLDEAKLMYDDALRLCPDYVEALGNRGVILKRQGDLTGAIAMYRRALALNPNFEITRVNLSIALCDLAAQKKSDSIEEAIRIYKEALVYNSKYGHAWYNLGVAHVEAGRPMDAIVCYETALLLNPRCPEAHNNLGVIAKDQGNLPKSIMHYRSALDINPALPQTLNNLGVIYTMMGETDQAGICCERAIRVDPSYAEVFNNLGVLMRDQGRIEESVSAYEKCIALDADNRNAAQNRLLVLNYSAAYPDAFVFAEHAKWGDSRLARVTPFKSFDNESLENGRALRVGFVSPDFVTHSVSYFIEAPLRTASAAWQIFCYNNAGRVDEKTEILQSFGHTWRDIHGMSATAVADLVRRDRIDVLVDLTGHTAHNRLDVFALRPAPVQITWIGYPNTTGLGTVDYRITDAIADPVDTQQNFSEELVRLPGAFLCYSPPPSYPDIQPLAALSNGFITFGSLNNLAKVTPDVIALWSRVLHRVPRSRMLLKCKPFATASVRQRVLAAFEAHGIERNRIDLLPLIASTAGHLQVYCHIDIALDTFPYAGTTTTTECLLMAVPVVTLRGSNHANNVGASLLSRLPCLESCVASSADEYVAIAERMSSDVAKLAVLHSSLRDVFLASSLCDGRAFMPAVESTFRRLFSRFIASRESRTASE